MKLKNNHCSLMYGSIFLVATVVNSQILNDPNIANLNDSTENGNGLQNIRIANSNLCTMST
jgi:hypothetical protein